MKINKKLVIEKDKLGRYVIYNEDTSELINLNNTASFFFSLVLKKKKIEEIEENFLKKFDSNKNEIKKDLINLVKDLKRKKIILSD